MLFVDVKKATKLFEFTYSTLLLEKDLNEKLFKCKCLYLYSAVLVFSTFTIHSHLYTGGTAPYIIFWNDGQLTPWDILYKRNYFVTKDHKYILNFTHI